MGWWVTLEGDSGEVESHTEGGVVAIGGSEEPSMSVTYNYSPFYYNHLDKGQGFSWLNEKVAKDTVERLEKAIKELGTEQSEDYWEATPGNAGHILNVLRGWAKQYPEGVWNVS